MALEWFASVVPAVTGITVFGHFEEKTPLWRRLSKWAFYFGMTGALSRWPGRHRTFVWIFGSPGIGLLLHVWWCRKYGIDALTAEPKDKNYELRGWEGP